MFRLNPAKWDNYATCCCLLAPASGRNSEEQPVINADVEKINMKHDNSCFLSSYDHIWISTSELIKIAGNKK